MINMNINWKLTLGVVMLLFAFGSCEKDDVEVVNKTFEISINGQQLSFDLSQEQFKAGFNIRSFNFFDNYATEEDVEDVITKNQAGLASEQIMFPDSTVQLSSFSFYSEENGLDYEAGLMDIALTVNQIDAFDQVLDATFSGTFTDLISNEEVTVSGIIKFGTTR